MLGDADSAMVELRGMRPARCQGAGRIGEPSPGFREYVNSWCD